MKRRGAILLVVMVALMMAAMIVAALAYRMHAEVGASTATLRGHQAYAAAMSGILYAQAVLQKNSDNQDIWYDNSDLFRNHFVCDDGSSKWYFTVYAPLPPDYDEPRYGVIDEGAKLNVNTASEDALTALLTNQDLVDALLDYRDTDSTPRAQGAEQDYYDQLKIPYVIKNGPLLTVEELLLVKGFNAELVYGEDANLNGLLDANENDGDESFPPDNSDGKLDMGLNEYLTTYSYELPSSGSDTRINLNGDLTAIKNGGLSDETVKFITVYREAGNLFTDPSQLLEMKYTLTADSKAYIDLKAGAEIESGVDASELPTLMEKYVALATNQKILLGRVNVNTASAKVLSALLGGEEGLADQIVEARSGLSDDERASTAWLFTKSLCDADQYKKIAPYLTTKSYQYRIRCVGFGYPCGRFVVLEAVLDFTKTNPRVLYLRDITRLGMPFAMNVQNDSANSSSSSSGSSSSSDSSSSLGGSN